MLHRFVLLMFTALMWIGMNTSALAAEDKSTTGYNAPAIDLTGSVYQLKPGTNNSYVIKLKWYNYDSSDSYWKTKPVLRLKQSNGKTYDITLRIQSFNEDKRDSKPEIETWERCTYGTVTEQWGTVYARPYGSYLEPDETGKKSGYIYIEVTFQYMDVTSAPTMSVEGTWVYYNNYSASVSLPFSASIDASGLGLATSGTISAPSSHSGQYSASFTQNPSSFSKFIVVSKNTSSTLPVDGIQSGSLTAGSNNNYSQAFSFDSNFNGGTFKTFVGQQVQRTITGYPCIDSKITNAKATFYQMFYRSHGTQTLKGAPKVSSIYAPVYNQWDKNVKLEWKRENPTNVNDNGKFVVWRTTANTFTNATRIGDTSNTTMTDNTIAYDNNYYYWVSYVPNGWSEGLVADLYQGPSAKTATSRTYKIDLSGTVKATSVDLKWTVPSISGSVDISGLKYVVTRNGVKLGEVALSAKTTTEYTYTDNTVPASCQALRYQVSIEALEGQVFKSKELSLTTDESRVLSLTASKGNFAGMVKLQWTAKQTNTTPTNYVVYRKDVNASEDKFVQITTISGTAVNYSYDDDSAQPGCYYTYRVSSSYQCESGPSNEVYVYDEGFCRGTGVVSGTVTYGSGTAVSGVKVALTKSNSTSSSAAVSQFGSLYFDGTPAEVVYHGNDVATLFAKGTPFSFQLWANPAEMQNHSGKAFLFDLPHSATLSLTVPKANTTYASYEVNVTAREGNNNETQSTGIYVNSREWSHYTFTHDGNGNFKLYVITGDENPELKSYSWTRSDWSLNATGFCFNKKGASYVMSGYLDEMRIWSGKALTEEEVLSNYNHPLNGNEEGLAFYWPLDEGIDSPTTAFDYSRTGNVNNSRHGTVDGGEASSEIPTSNQFSLHAVTDAQGNYTINSIPFAGDGTTYMITPTMGSHKFNPISKSRYFSANSLVYSGVDFSDESSFPVSGVVYYENTNYPVEGCNIYVDGVIAAKDGNAVVTKSDGSFEVDVPIGNHSISIKKNDHTFVDGGRWPADPDGLGLTYTFEKAETGITFFDNTLVTVAGRVTGGVVEAAKPLGFGASVANIGQAQLVLYTSSTVASAAQMNLKIADQNGAAYTREPNDSRLQYQAATSDVNSEAYVMSGSSDAVKKIIIKTDPKTGEFAVKLPPVEYFIHEATIPSNSEISFTSLPKIDASHPSAITTDSIDVTDKAGTTTKKKFDYVASVQLTHREPTTFIVTDGKSGNAAFGESAYTFNDEAGNSQTLDNLYTVDQNGNVTYQFGYPIFLMQDNYTLELEAYEEYHNQDEDADASLRNTIVPLDSINIEISNALGAGTQMKSSTGSDNGALIQAAQSTVVLDKEGKATYGFKCSMPNISASSNYTLQMSMDYGGTTPWTMSGIVIGSIPSGNNFVTAGPDQVTMIIRDPGGSLSSCSWEEGVEFTQEYTNGFTYNDDVTISTVTKCGVKIDVAAGFGVMTINNAESIYDINGGTELVIDEKHNTKNTVTTKLTKKVSTSDDALYVGANGDVFIGTSTNYLFGKVTKVGFFRSNDSSPWTIGTKDALGMSTQYKTVFHYDQNYIERVLIPNFIATRDALLLEPGTSVNTATITEPKYVSRVARDNGNWGRDLTYDVYYPANYRGQDTIVWLNNQVRSWRQRLAANEEAKVTAINNASRYLIDNYSFSSGVTIEQSTDSTTSRGWHNETQETLKISLGTDFGMTWNSTGTVVSMNQAKTVGYTHTADNDSIHTTTFAFTLKEEGDDDALSIDVYRAPDGFGPIFYNKAGQTSCPFEDEVRTSYFEAGEHVISAKTWQIEKVEFALGEGTNTQISGVPSGSQALFHLGVLNTSETYETGSYGIAICENTNIGNAGFTLNGNEMGDGRVLMLPAHETLNITVGLNQTDESILDYENVGIRVYSLCQSDNTGTFPEIADTIYLSAHFQPTCSEIALGLSTPVVNTTLENPSVVLTASGYDINASSLQAVRLQIRQAGSANWVTLQEYVKSGATANQLLLPSSKLNYTLDMSNSITWPDQTYDVRAVTVCDFGDGEELGESTYQTLVRDLSRPQLISLPSPSDGVLNAGDEIAINFNEDIISSALNKTSNFIVQGELNGYTVDHQTAMQLAEGAVAKTSSKISLNNRAWAVNTWLRYSEAGSFLSHGVDEATLSLSIDATGHLVANLSGENYTSINTIPADTWCFVALSIDEEDDEYVLNGNYAYDATDKVLFNNVSINAYKGSSPLTVGGSLKGQLHELSIWDYARTWVESQSEMYEGKSRYTSGLIGYWPLNEGHGVTATDHARSRDLTMTTASWYLADKNMALVLDGTQAAAIPVGSCATQNDQSYLVETWFSAEPTQNGNIASIFGWGNDAVEFRLNQGKPQLVINGNVVGSVSGNYLDGQWHHVAFNVLKGTSGSAILYLDGQAVRQVAASTVPAFQTDNLMLGAHRTTVNAATANYQYSNMLKGGIDEVRIWHGNLTASSIKNNMYQRISAESDGLVAYYPMEKQQLDGALQSVTVADFADHSTDPSGSLTLLAGINAEIGNFAPALKSAPLLQNASFSYVASERKILISLTDAPSVLEGVTLNFTVRGVYDTHSNTCEPIHWSALVRQNQLLWSDDEISIRKEAGKAATFTVDITNEGATNESWSVSGLPSWLSTSVSGGTLAAGATRTLTFTVDAATAIGKYEETIFLTGGLGIAEPLTVSLSSVAESPDWSVDPAKYSSSMIFVGQINVDGILSNDTEDMVGAFVGEECVGVAQPTYISRYDACYVMMTVYGDSEKPLTFKVFDASAGEIRPSVHAILNGEEKDVKYVSDGMMGDYTTPVIWTPDSKIEQEISYTNGWRWRSLYVTPADSKVSTIFADAAQDIEIIKNVTSFASVTSAGVFEGSLINMEVGKSYKIKANNEGHVIELGEAVNNTATTLSVASGWNWIGYTVSQTLSPNAAFSDLEPTTGDVVKSQTQFAIYGESEWIGTLKTMTPGEGYLYNSKATSAKSFHYPTVSGANRVPRRTPAMSENAEYVNINYAGNMNVIAKLMNGAMQIDEAVISIYDQEGILRSRQQSTVDNGLYFLTIPGDMNGQQLNVVVEYNGESYLLGEGLIFNDNAVIGTLDEPFVFNLNSANGIEMINAESDTVRYNFSGQRIDNNQAGFQIERNEKGARKMVK